MALPTREAVFSSLFALLTPLAPATFTTVTRRMIMPSDVTAAICPMLILWERDQVVSYTGNILPITELMADLIIYFINPVKNEMNPSDPALTAGATILNPLMDAVVGALALDDWSSGRLTLKLAGVPQVSWCRIEGQVYTETGDTDPHGLGGSQIPLRIRVGE